MASIWIKQDLCQFTRVSLDWSKRKWKSVQPNYKRVRAREGHGIEFYREVLAGMAHRKLDLWGNKIRINRNDYQVASVGPWLFWRPLRRPWVRHWQRHSHCSFSCPIRASGRHRTIGRFACWVTQNESCLWFTENWNQLHCPERRYLAFQLWLGHCRSNPRKFCLFWQANDLCDYKKGLKDAERNLLFVLVATTRRLW